MILLNIKKNADYFLTYIVDKNLYKYFK